MKKYEAAETRLKGLQQEFPATSEFFYYGPDRQSWARDSTATMQTERLNRALANYRLQCAALTDSDRALLSHAHESMGRILAFLDKEADALKEFEAAISLGDVPGGAYRDALEGKRKLGLPK